MNKLNSLNRKLSDHTKQISKKRSSFLPFVSTSIQALRESKLTDDNLVQFKDFFRETVNSFPTSTELLSVYDQLDTNFVFTKIYPILEKHLQTKIVDSYMSLLSMRNDQNKGLLSIDQAKILFEIIKSHPEYFDNHDSAIKKSISELFFERPVINVFKGESQSAYISDEAIINYLTTIQNDSPDINEKIELLSSLRHDNTLDQVLDKLTELINYQSSVDVPERRVMLANYIKFVIDLNTEKIKTISNKGNIESICTNISSWYSQDSDWKNKKIYFYSIRYLKIVNENPAVSAIESVEKHFIQNAPYEILKGLARNQIEELILSFPDEFKSAVLRDPKVYELGEKTFPDESKLDLVVSLLEKSKEIVNAEEKKSYFDLIAKLKCCSDSSVINNFHAELISMKEADSVYVKKISRKKNIFNQAQKKELNKS